MDVAGEGGGGIKNKTGVLHFRLFLGPIIWILPCTVVVFASPRKRIWHAAARAAMYFPLIYVSKNILVVPLFVELHLYYVPRNAFGIYSSRSSWNPLPEQLSLYCFVLLKKRKAAWHGPIIFDVRPYVYVGQRTFHKTFSTLKGISSVRKWVELTTGLVKMLNIFYLFFPWWIMPFRDAPRNNAIWIGTWRSDANLPLASTRKRPRLVHTLVVRRQLKVAYGK